MRRARGMNTARSLALPVLAPALGSGFGWQDRTQANRSGVQWQPVFWTVIALLALTHLTMALAIISPATTALVIATRRLCWVIVGASALVAIVQGRPGTLFGPLLPLAPFALVGLASTLLSVEPGAGLVAMALWLATMVAACLIGERLRGADLPMVLIGWFTAAMAGSIALALLRPHIGTTIDGRFHYAVWRGVFVGKNWLAWYAGFALLLAVFASGARWYWRVGLGLLAAVALHGAHSAGSVAAIAATLGIMALFGLWRRLGLSPGMQVLANATVLGGGALVGWAGYAVFLASLGRDVTLTGRTQIWQAYFSRALDTWAFGAGPGSFTDLSLTTGDVGLRFQHLGRIFTPHNMFIAVFGEIGLVGLAAFGLSMAVMLGQALRLPRGAGRNLVLAFMLLFLISGLDETHEVFGTGSGLFLIVLLRAWLGPQARVGAANA